MAKRRLSYNAKGWIADRPVFAWIAAALFGAAGVYSCLFFAAKPIELSYAAPETCISWPTLFPDLYKTVDDTQFTVQFTGGVRIFNVAVLSTKTCIHPGNISRVGDVAVATAPFGGMLYRQHFIVSMPPPPAAAASNGLDKPLSATKPLVIKLAGRDVISIYQLRIGDKVSACRPMQSAAVECEVAALGMSQGAEYDLQILRGFKGQKPVVTLQKHITTLTATTIIDGSIKPGDTVYARPTELLFTADKDLAKAEAALVEEGGTEKASVTTTAQGRTIKIALEKELPREKSYVLTLQAVDAADGSSLAEPYVVPFTTSGGPKVVSVSAGKSGVATNARIVVTFDQTLSDKQDITKFANITGGAATISRSGNQITYTLQGLPLCTPFTLNVVKGLESNYDIASAVGWSYTSRTICHTTAVYGYSVKGRPLVAYYFGTSGPVTMYVGAIHGNEPSSSGLMKAWIDDLEASPDLYTDRRIVVIPTINPDGVAAGTRTNARGVNLNRNFPTDGWVKDINDTDGTHPGGGGSEPLSEPEAKALAAITTSLRPRLLLSFHAVGSLVVGDPGGYSAGYAAKYASMVGYRNATGQGGTFDYDITGAYEDWTYAKQGIPSMVIELGSYSYYNFPYHRAALRAMLQ